MSPNFQNEVQALKNEMKEEKQKGKLNLPGKGKLGTSHK